MSSYFNVVWTIRSTQTPVTNRPCGRCGVVRPFTSTGKFRLNANGNRLDAWLIYKCMQCEKRWNRTVFERRPVSSITKEQLVALQENDAGIAEEVVRQSSHSALPTGSDGGPQLLIETTLPSRQPVDGEEIKLTVQNPSGCRARLDQVLAKGLGLSRKDILDLFKSGVISVVGGGHKALKRPVPEIIELRVQGTSLLFHVDIRTRLLGAAMPTG
ncbi:DUF1062 domain-containing protein [Roseibium sp. SCP14]|uniref:DUF1062 domain-containing protein n=1 Tax=Roseibium sp. SCP14 TaxID=3141375 RepID=UPI00333676CB